MKQVRSLAGAMLLSALFFTSAHAIPRWTYEDVNWRTSSVNQSGVAAKLDSAVKNHAPSADAHVYDTTATISLEDWAAPPPVYPDSLDSDRAILGNVAQDTLIFGAVYYVPVAGVTAAIDTVFFTAQVSNDGWNWVQWGTPTQNYVATLGTGDNVHTNGIMALDFGSEGGAYIELPMFPQSAATIGAASISSAPAAAPSPGRLFGGWRFIRFIVISDASGSYRFKVGRWKEVHGYNKLVTDKLSWRTSVGVEVDSDLYVDSTSFKQTGARTDTSVAVSTDGWTYNDILNMKTSALQADSLFYGQVLIAPNESNLGSGFTSTTIATQVSLNGRNWIVGGVTGNVTATQVGSTKHSFLYLKAGSGRATAAGPRMPLSGTAPIRSQVFGFPFVRFIVIATVNGQFDGFVKRWQTVVPEDIN